MKEGVGNLWNYYDRGFSIVITTNGFVKKNGCGVMGRGCAKEAADLYPNLPLLLGTHIKKDGNTPFKIYPQIYTLPVKHNWWEEADPNLIRDSLLLLLPLIGSDEVVYMPRPGCGNGRLDWESVVKPVCEMLLDDRFVVITYE
jgi:hypothetical protein